MYNDNKYPDIQQRKHVNRMCQSPKKKGRQKLKKYCLLSSDGGANTVIRKTFVDVEIKCKNGIAPGVKSWRKKNNNNLSNFILTRWHLEYAIKVLTKQTYLSIIHNTSQTHTHTHKHTHTHINTHTHIRIHTYMYIYMYIHNTSQTHTHTHKHTHTYINTHTHTYVYTHTYTYISIHTQYLSNTHTHT